MNDMASQKKTGDLGFSWMAHSVTRIDHMAKKKNGGKFGEANLYDDIFLKTSL